MASDFCTYGDKCQFAHGLEELRPASKDLRDRIENKSKRPAGTALFQLFLPFLFNNSLYVVEFDDGPMPAKREAIQIVKREMCKHGEKCIHGLKCTFAHNPSELGTIAIVFRVSE
jgi:hypothetical protein